MTRRILKNRGVRICLMIIAALVLTGIFAPLLAPHDPLEVQVKLKYAAPSLSYPAGNDYLGRDVFSRLIYGIRPSLIWVLISMFCINLIALFFSVMAGYRRGRIDEVIMRVCDIMLSFPTEIMVLAIVGIIGVGLRNILIVVILLGWPWYARVYRSIFIKYSTKNYVQFSQAIGTRFSRILFTELLPAALPEITVLAMGQVASLILSISSYSFLGLGVQAPTPEWGAMLNQAKESLALNPQQMIAPAVTVVGVCIVFSLFADVLRNALDVQYVRTDWRRKRRKWMREHRKASRTK